MDIIVHISMTKTDACDVAMGMEAQLLSLSSSSVQSSGPSHLAQEH